MKNRYKVLIPGGTGFIGYHLCIFCIKKGWKVHSVSKSKPKKNRKVRGVKYILCDVTNKQNLKEIESQINIEPTRDFIADLSSNTLSSLEQF